MAPKAVECVLAELPDKTSGSQEEWGEKIGRPINTFLPLNLSLGVFGFVR